MTLDLLRFSLSVGFLLEDPRRAGALPPDVDVSGESYAGETVALPALTVVPSGDLPAELSGDDAFDSNLEGSSSLCADELLGILSELECSPLAVPRKQGDKTISSAAI